MTQHTTRNSQRAAGLEDLFTFLDPSGNSIPGTNTPSHPPTPANMSSQHKSAHIETLDETPDKTLGTTNPNQEAEAFAKAIDKIVKVLRVSALHYSAGDQISEGFRTVASARALRQPTSCGSEYFYNQCPRVRNLIGTECSLNISERRVKKEAS